MSPGSNSDKVDLEGLLGSDDVPNNTKATSHIFKVKQCHGVFSTKTVGSKSIHINEVQT